MSYTIALYIIPVLGVLIGSYARIKPFSYAGVYIFLSALTGFVAWLQGSLSDLFIALGFSLAGALVALCLLGAFGEKYRMSSYMSVAATLGLFPWLYNPVSTYIYIGVVIAAVLFTFVIDNMRKRNIKTKEVVKERLIIGLPVVIGALVALLYTY